MARKGVGFLLVALWFSQAKADEGMWLLPLVEEFNMMEQLGCKLSASDLYSEDTLSLKDVIGSIDHGSCTGGLISGEGLFLTNHHCGENEIQNHSSSSHNYLADGFWAMSKGEELPNPGKTVSFVIGMEEVTGRVLGMVHQEMTENEMESEIESVSGEIVDEAIEGTHYEAFVVPFYEGNQYYLIVLETFRDVRLVGAPPESIGRFGGDADNWEWPRHNADFCLFRIYTAPDGSPAEYAPDNIPYRPGNYLPISLNGYKKDDFSLVLGFPGKTNRYLTSEAVKEIREINNANRIKIRKQALDIMERDMQADEKVHLQYSVKHSALSNYYKYSIGQNRCIRLGRIEERRKAQEVEFQRWIAGDTLLQKEYSGILEDIKESIRDRREMENALSYLEEVFLLHKAVEVYDFAASALTYYFEGMGEDAGKEEEENLMRDLKQQGKNFFHDYNPDTDRKIASVLINQYARWVEPIYFPGIFSTIHKKFHGDIDRYLEHLYLKSIFTDPSRFSKFTERPKQRTLLKDPAFLGAFALYSTYYQIMDEYEALENKYQAASRKYVRGLMAMYPDSLFYPDANSTLRFSYGTISGYHARDAVTYDYYTTLSGVLEKEDPYNPDFLVPGKLKDLYNQKNFYPYSKDSTMKVCFLSNLDTTGGNSGSPVLNDKGEIIGINFDGNWESMGGDIIFETTYQRSICVDIRYVLFIVDRFAGAGHLLEEMDLHD